MRSLNLEVECCTLEQNVAPLYLTKDVISILFITIGLKL